MSVKVASQTKSVRPTSRTSPHFRHELLTPIAGSPPVQSGIGRRRNPIYSSIYNHLISNKNVWFHVEIAFDSPKSIQKFRSALYARTKKDSFTFTSASSYNEESKSYDVWVMLY
jgi:sRNA-binding carbon storage regulator CsrA